MGGARAGPPALPEYAAKISYFSDMTKPVSRNI